MEKYTIILAHYNQMEYIEEAIASVMKQDYKNIELIVADDCSPEFNYDKIEKIIKKHNKHNFEYKIIQTKTNSGTVKNLNNALKKATGDFVQFFASDDALYNNKVVSRFVKEFQDKSKNIITAQSIMCDKDLKVDETYVDVKMAKRLNKKGPSALFQKMSEYCIYSSGATAYRTKILKENNLFDERYKFVEDWTSWIKLTRNGEMIYYVDFIAFKHRDGGISHSEYTKETLPNHVRGYYRDLLEAYKVDILPYIDGYKLSEQYRILKRMEDNNNYFGYFAPELYSYQKDLIKKINSNSKLKKYWRIRRIMQLLNVNIIHRIKMLIKFNRVVPITVIVWILSCVLFNSLTNIDNNNLLLGIYLGLYVLIYVVVFEIDRIIWYLTTRKIYSKKNKK